VLKKPVLLKGTASAVPQVIVRKTALAAEVCFLFREALLQHVLKPSISGVDEFDIGASPLNPNIFLNS
jgi:hypothetical protein